MAYVGCRRCTGHRSADIGSGIIIRSLKMAMVNLAGALGKVNTSSQGAGDELRPEKNCAP